MLSKVKQFLLNRLDERSTWRALVMMAVAMGVTLDAAQWEAIIVAGMAFGAVLEAFLPDPAGRMREPRDELPDAAELQSSSEADPARRARDSEGIYGAFKVD